MWSGVTVLAMSRLVIVWEVCLVLASVDGLSNSYRSMRLRGMGSWNGGWLRVVRIFSVCLGS